MKNEFDINNKYQLKKTEIDFFKSNGFLKLNNVLSKNTLSYYHDIFYKVVNKNNSNNLPMEERNTYQKAFIQVGNLWEKNEIIKSFVFGKKISRIVSELLDVNGVRLYHDQALFKESGGGFTPWHADQYYWPFASEKCCTAWIPLQDTSLNMGPISFAKGSHRFEYGRKFEISDESENKIKKSFTNDNYEIFEESFNLGDISFHYGWTFHRAAKNQSKKTRGVMTIIFMDSKMKLKKPENTNQESDKNKYCPGIKIGNMIMSEKNPIIFERN